MSQERNAKFAPVPWTVKDIAKAIAWLLVSLVALYTVVGLILMATGESLDRWAASAAVGIIFYGFIMVTVWRFSVFKYRTSWDALGFRYPELRVAIVSITQVLAAAVVINVVYQAILNYSGVGPQNPTPFPVESTHGAGNLALLVVLVVIAAPIAEETFFRGFLFAGLGRRLGYAWGAILSAAIFALAHIDPEAYIPIFFLGLLLAWLYYRTRSIWVPVLAHFLYNSIALLFMII